MLSQLYGHLRKEKKRSNQGSGCSQVHSRRRQDGIRAHALVVANDVGNPVGNPKSLVYFVGAARG